jgi:hypothetical protein
MNPLRQAWVRLVLEFAAEAARDARVVLRRLEAPPLPPSDEGAHGASNEKWLAADAAYREMRRAREAEIREADATGVALLRGTAHLFWSPSFILGLAMAGIVYALLQHYEKVEAAEGVVADLAALGWNWLWR